MITNKLLFQKALAKDLKVLYLDIETSPQKVWTYTTHDAYIPHTQIEEDKQITSVAWLWEGSSKVYSREWGVKRNDRNLLKDLSKVMNSADLWVSQNGDAFDIPTIQWRLNVRNLPPLQKVFSIDTLKSSRGSFFGSSHTLDYRSRVYEFGGKIKQDMEDCIRVAKGDRIAQRKRIIYNIKDVVDLRRIFWKELNYVKLTKTIRTFLTMFINSDGSEYCIKCASQKHPRFNIERHGKKRHCLNCDSVWRVE